MGFVYVVATLMILPSVALILWEFWGMILWMISLRVDAVIVDLKDATWNHGMHRFCYRFELDGTKHRMWGPWQESWNPVMQIFPRKYLGQTVSVRVRPDTGKIVRSPLYALVYIVAALMLMFCGIFLLAVL